MDMRGYKAHFCSALQFKTCYEMLPDEVEDTVKEEDVVEGGIIRSETNGAFEMEAKR